MANFDFIAPFYDFLARLVFGDLLLKSQSTYFLRIPSKGATILILGGGSGKILEKLSESIQTANICYVEASQKMLNMALKSTVAERLTIEWIHGTEKDLPKGRKFDFVITPFVLDVFPNEKLGVAMDKLSQHMQENGIWLFTDFNVPDTKWKFLSAGLIRIMYKFFRLVAGLKTQKLPDFDKQFVRIGLKKEEEKYYLFQTIVARIYRRLNGTGSGRL